MDSSVPAAPPTEQGVFEPEPIPATWPKALGILSIVLGSLGTLGNIWGILAPFFLDAIAPHFGNDPTTRTSFHVQRELAPWNVCCAMVNMVAGVLLLMGGIGFIMHRPWGVKATKAWIILRILGAVSTTIVGVMAMKAVLAESSPQTGSAASVGMIRAFAGIGIAFGFAWGCAYPIFMAIWLTRPRIREEIATWE